MFIILVYDVNKKRDGAILKICRKYLSHVQKSVFEGSITQSKLNKLKEELRKTIDFDEDSICIYAFGNTVGLLKEKIGVNVDNSPVI